MKVLYVSILCATLLGFASLSAAGEIDVMTQNQYIGADLQLGATASTQEEVDAAVIGMLTVIAQSRPAERVRTLAAEIAQRNPDVVGLQEAFEFKCLPDTEHGFPPLPGKGCDDPLIKDALTDHLQRTEEVLHGKYVVVGKVTNLQVSPIFFGVNDYRAVLSITDRDAILVRKHLSDSAQVVKFNCLKPSDDGCNYETAPPPFQPLLGPHIALERGFLAVDVTVKGLTYRVFNTHLEQRLLAATLPQTRFLQIGQALELLQAAMQTPDKRVIVVGDMNSDPRDRTRVAPPPPPPFLTPYELFTQNGFTDTWLLQRHVNSGFTCCQDADLLNPQSKLTERIDMIFSLHRPSQVLDMEILGNASPAGNGGIWPSDHAAVAGRLKFHSPLYPVHIERD